MTIDEINKLYALHLNGKSISQICREQNICETTVLRNFKKNGLKTIKRNFHIDQATIDNIISLYNKGYSFKEISEFGISSPATICRILKKNNINARPHIEHRDKTKKYYIDEYYFNTINTNEKAYILGLLYADGNANKKYHHITLKLQEKDKSILDKISKLISTNKPLHFSKKIKNTHQNQYVLKITNSLIYKDLIKYGVIPNKTFKLKFPEWLDDKFLPHFIRGYFDGDGCMYVSKISGIDWNMIGSSDFIKSVANILQEKLGIKSTIEHDARCKIGIDKIRVRKTQDILALQKWMYKNSTIHLDRKFMKFEEIKILRNKK